MQSGSPLTYGRPASPQEARAIAALVRSYYRASAADDGVRLCSLLYSLYAENVPDDYGSPPGPPALRGNSCPVVLHKLFRQRRLRQRRELASLRVTGARISYLSGLALLDFGGAAPPSYIPVRRERGTWKIDGLVEQPAT